MADTSLDDIIRKRQIKFGTNTGGTFKGKFINKTPGRIGFEPTGDMRSKIIAKKRANIVDARQNLRGRKMISTTSSRLSSVKQRISAPKEVITAPGSDAKKLTTRKNFQTTHINTRTAQRIVNDIKTNNYEVTGSQKSTLIRTLNNLRGNQNRFQGSTKGRLNRPVEYVTEEVPVEFEEVPYEEYVEEEPVYEYEAEPAVIAIEDEPTTFGNVQYRQSASRPKARLNYQQRNTMNQRPRQNYNNRTQIQQNGRNQGVQYVDAVDNGNAYVQTNYQSNMNGTSNRNQGGGYGYGKQNHQPWTNNPQQQQQSLQAPVYQAAPQQQQQAQPQRRNMISNVLRSRLDQPKQAPPVQEHPGYRVLVTNLNVKVTLEDIKELFGNIGPLRNAHMPQRGTAEVLFINEQDAHSSVQAYNDRLLDGQAMNVLFLGLGSKKPLIQQQQQQRMMNTGMPQMRQNNSFTGMPQMRQNNSFLKSARF